jgi:hypothetical protein
LSYPCILQFEIVGVGHARVASSGIDRCGDWWDRGEKGRVSLGECLGNAFKVRRLILYR